MSTHLFSPFALRDVEFKNRIAVSPMAQYSAENGAVQPWHVQHLGALAAGAPGLLFIEATSVERRGYGYRSCLALHTDAQLAAMSALISSIRSYSRTPIALQLNHNGRKASSYEPARGRGPLLPDEGGWLTYGPSAISFGDNWPLPVEMSLEDIGTTVSSFIAAATRAATMDIQVLELHGAHGYLLHSFLSPISNRREDAYGGTFEKRLRFVSEIVHGVRAAWPAGRVLGIRLNAQDWAPGGLTVDDTIAIVHRLKEAGCDYVCLSAGAIDAKTRIVASPGWLAPFASRVKRATGVATFVTGMIVDPAMANQLIAEDHADMVAIARAFLDDPRWVWRAAEALGLEAEYPTQYLQARPAAWPAIEIARGIRLKRETTPQI